MKSKGMVYTTFAIIGTSLLILLFAFTATVEGDYTSEKNPFRIGEASYYIKNIEKDLERAQRIASRIAASSAVERIVAEGEELENVEQALINGTLRGEFNGEEINSSVNSSLNSWADRVIGTAKESRYQLSINFTDLNFEDDYLSLESRLQASTVLEDPTTLAEFNRTPENTEGLDMTGYEDTMILLRTGERYVNNYKACGFDVPAEKIGEGTGNSGATYGDATRDDPDSVPDANRSEKILVTAIPPSPENAGDFAGVVSQDDPGYNDTTTKYVYGLSNSELDSIQEGERLILYDDQVWSSNIRQMINEGCYLRSTGEKAGPGIMERMKNQLTPATGENEGLVTLLDKPRIPPQLQYIDRSNAGYVYFNQSGNYGGLEQIAGVTGGQAYGDREYRNGFRLDQYHIEEWNLSGLTY